MAEEPDRDGEAVRALRESDPVDVVRVDPVVAARLVRAVAGDEIHSAESPKEVERVIRRVRRARRRWVPVFTGVAAALVVVGLGAPVTASLLFRAQTGVYDQGGPPGGSASAGAEWIDSSASDFEEYMESIYPAWLPLPSGVDPVRFAAQEANLYAEAAGDSRSTDVTMQFAYEMAAHCLWRDEYSRARANGDTPRALRALDVLDEAVTWPAVVASDAGGVVDSLREAAQRARAGDDDPLQRWNRCPRQWTLDEFGVPQ